MDLRNEAMRDRHWQALSKECNSKTIINPSEPRFCLEDLLELQLQGRLGLSGRFESCGPRGRCGSRSIGGTSLRGRVPWLGWAPRPP